MMIRTPVHFMVLFRCPLRHWYLLWREGVGKQHDAFVTEGARFRCEHSPHVLRVWAMRRGFEVSSEPPHVVDITALSNLLNRLEPGIPLKSSQAQLLLECWNTFEDLASSLRMNSVFGDLLSADSDVTTLYDKLYYGNNLPSVTPPGSVYEPELDPMEVELLRTALPGLWNEIYFKTKQFEPI